MFNNRSKIENTMTKHDEKATSTRMMDISRAIAIELVIKNIAGAKERVFRFDIKYRVTVC